MKQRMKRRKAVCVGWLLCICVMGGNGLGEGGLGTNRKSKLLYRVLARKFLKINYSPGKDDVYGQAN